MVETWFKKALQNFQKNIEQSGDKDQGFKQLKIES